MTIRGPSFEMKEKLTSETRPRYARNLVIGYQEPLLPAHEHDTPLSPLPTAHRQGGSA